MHTWQVHPDAQTFSAYDALPAFQWGVLPDGLMTPAHRAHRHPHIPHPHTHDAMKLGGAPGPRWVWCGPHLAGQVPGAVEGVAGGPGMKGLLTIKEDQLQGQV